MLVCLITFLIHTLLKHISDLDLMLFFFLVHFKIFLTHVNNYFCSLLAVNLFLITHVYIWSVLHVNIFLIHYYILSLFWLCTLVIHIPNFAYDRWCNRPDQWWFRDGRHTEGYRSQPGRQWDALHPGIVFWHTGRAGLPGGARHLQVRAGYKYSFRNLVVSSIYLANQFKMGMYLLNREKGLNAFPRSTDIIEVLNELPTGKRHIVLHDQTSVESL